MTTLFMFDPVGGFVAVDTVTRRTAYAYPSSEYAAKARKDPAKVAAEMVGREWDRDTFPPSMAVEIRQRDEARIALVTVESL